MPCSKGMRRCHRACLHRALVQNYHLARHAAMLAEDEITKAGATERRDHRARFGRPITFRDWLRGHRTSDERLVA